MTDTTVTINDFADLLEMEALPAETLQTLLIILSEISLKRDRFESNTGELLILAVNHSPTFQALSLKKQELICAVLCMPLFFLSRPPDEENNVVLH
ncbi:unnamed protein product [Klebsiella pneumoniae subsp. rhinoscleromatis SB3432]|uniref:Uncharacterized protein n=1 Tax=Klebsiella pneumoniae TaxID=573 RepID=A0A377X484_KLEPN|nr:hypothetical protein [Klebsiella pneumoniae]CCI78515.1 unnamed protein product [Klebsiella pneumoniae subsp. rhinoscleromatis SB3432]STV63690.1 Uncharacterised protein [Klebsiella pneumoniae subsp. rhinoscleromatis]EEW42918.1 hypothetical protein HMPREF0484_1036 [Klebsiella pneumoniae subsp. rhinoscleromatis ATCC 13884]STT68580.1 Uncharacterised protein [Klebsiella pneumoniae]STT78416.1 Uncharacterised protein [Klebsiella pneumoniae]